MSCDHLAIGDSHPVWKLPPRSKPEVRKGIVKSRIITGTYILQIIAGKAFCIVIIHRNLPRYHFFDFSIMARQ
jgi:hypothetical protein